MVYFIQYTDYCEMCTPYCISLWELAGWMQLGGFGLVFYYQLLWIQVFAGKEAGGELILSPCKDNAGWYQVQEPFQEVGSPHGIAKVSYVVKS